MLLVDSKLKFVAGPVRSSVAEPAFSNRTPMGFAALKIKPSAVLRPRTAANCNPMRRVSETRAAVGAETGEAAGDRAFAGAGVDVDCGLRFLRPLPMRADTIIARQKGNAVDKGGGKAWWG